METSKNAALDLLGIGAFSTGITLVQTDLLTGSILMAAGLLAVLIKYYTRTK